MADEQQYCTFYVAGYYFGLDVLNVQEIIRYQEMTRVPLAPPVVRGLINLRGQIVTALDLRDDRVGHAVFVTDFRFDRHAFLAHEAAHRVDQLVSGLGVEGHGVRLPIRAS